MLPSRREERRILSLAPPTFLESPAWDHEDLIPLRPPQQTQGKVTCESPLRVRGRNRRYLCSHVTGAPAKCCTSGTAVNKAGEAGEPQQRAAGGSGDLQPLQQPGWGEGVEIKAKLPRRAQTPEAQAHSPNTSSWKPLSMPGHPPSQVSRGRNLPQTHCLLLGSAYCSGS